MDSCEVCGVCLEDVPARCGEHAHTEDSDVEYWAHGGPYPSVAEQIAVLLAEANGVADLLVNSLDYDSEVYQPTTSEELAIERCRSLKRCLDEIEKLLKSAQ